MGDLWAFLGVAFLINFLLGLAPKLASIAMLKENCAHGGNWQRYIDKEGRHKIKFET